MLAEGPQFDRMNWNCRPERVKSYFQNEPVRYAA